MNSQETSVIYSHERIQQFALKYSNSLIKSFDSSKVRCGIIHIDELQIAAQLIRSGQLVAFPTETVYGLGANALDEDAIKSIYTTKKRPLNDPVIMHLSHSSEISQYVEDDKQIVYGEQFWPAKQSALKTTQILSANTGYVGFRIPDNIIALQLIKLAGVPIAAPSANIFAHVSPTSPIHVFNDFYDQKIHIIDGDISQNGIESTVVKIQNNEIIVLRRGSLPIDILRNHLLFCQKVTINEQLKNEQESTEAPGQYLKHYAPYIPTFILNFATGDSKIPFSHQKFLIIDFKHYAQDIISKVQKQENEPETIVYKSLSDSGDLEEAMHNFYDTLRWAENQEIEIILITDIRVIGLNENDHFNTLFDKIYRSAEGQFISYNNIENCFYKN